MSTELASIPKNAKERIVVSDAEYNGIELVDIRVYFQADDGEWHPTKKGVSLRWALFGELLAALNGIERPKAGGRI
ncbi:MAG: transcriptional coactivator p15/PC4 family protein [Armatimonadetes bacterium]|nr:transcriptional coactivator p15/PC4 family protein [Armatimonadota bacterium]